MTLMETMRLGANGPLISRLGMGCWAIGGHGWGDVDEGDSVRAVQYALEHGINFFDTADAYGLGYSEQLLTAALGKKRKDVVIATKGGVRWNSDRKIWVDISPSYLQNAVESSLRRLKLDHISLYYIHKPDGTTPISESVAGLERLRQEGKIGAIGLANFSVAHVAEALKVAPISALQVRLNMFDDAALFEYRDICQQNNINLVAWGALADGLLTGKFTPTSTFSDDDHRVRMPDFSGQRFLMNLKCVEQLRQWADAKRRPLSQLALRWILDSATVACPLFGAKTDIQVEENLNSGSWNLSTEDLDVINTIIRNFRR